MSALWYRSISIGYQLRRGEIDSVCGGDFVEVVPERARGVVIMSIYHLSLSFLGIVMHRIYYLDNLRI